MASRTDMTKHVPSDAACGCDNCDWEGPAFQMDMIKDFEERVSPGAIVPAGECPKCNALAYVKGRAPSYEKLRRAVEEIAAIPEEEPGTDGWTLSERLDMALRLARNAKGV